MRNTEIVPGVATSLQRQSNVKDDKTNAQCILHIKVLSCCLALVAAVCIAIIAVLSWHIINTDCRAELTQIVMKMEKLNATIQNQGHIIQENDKLHNENRDMIQSAVQNLESGKQGRNATHLSFSATLGSLKKYLSPETIVFKAILNNDGDAYNASTGIFTAPVDGKYWFSASINVYHQAYADVRMMKNNFQTVRVYPDRRGYSSDNYETATVSTVMDLQSGDTVYCRWAQGTTSTPYSVYHTDFNSFSGVLLTQY